MARVIVFGPSGGVGSAVVSTAASLGAQLTLAMRNPAKGLPGLKEAEATHGPFSRVQADLTDVDSMSRALKSSQATRAFIYFAHQSKDFMRSAIEALKAAGIEFVVFLSSSEVPKEPADARPEDLLAYIHGQAEIRLREVFGSENYAAVRPGAFSTNLFQYSHGIKTGEVGVFGAAMREAHISPSDVGVVAGTILVKGSRNKTNEVWVFGPQRIRTDEAIGKIASAMGKTVQIKELTAAENIEQQVQHGFPRPIAEYLARTTEDGVRTGGFSGSDFYEEGVSNVELYKGSPGQGIEEWIEENQVLLQ